MKKTAKIKLMTLGVFIIGSAAAMWGYVYHQAGKMIYYRLPYEVWIRKRPAECTPKRKKLVFSDMRPGVQGEKPLELSCEEALNLPAEEHFATTEQGMKIHYKVYNPPSAPASPIMLYISGVTSSYLDGARYFKMAQRLGFQLVSIDLSNHGISDNNGKGAAFGCREELDVFAVFKELYLRFPDQDFMLMGTSMGTMAIANAAEELMALDTTHRLKAVELENPAPSVKRVMMDRPQTRDKPEFLKNLTLAMAGWRAGYDFTACSPVNQLKHLKIPTFVQTSKNDQLIPIAMAQEVFSALPAGLPNQFKVYPYGDHAAVWNGQPEEYEADLAAFWARSQGYWDKQPGSHRPSPSLPGSAQPK